MVFQDLLTSKDDYLRASRALLREIIKQTKHEINFQAFCLGLMQERKEPQYLDMEFKVGGWGGYRPPSHSARTRPPLVRSGQSQRAAGLRPVRGPGRGWLGAPRGSGLGAEVGPADLGSPRGQ